jgi:ferrochelatase
MLVKGIIVPFRSPKSAAKYKTIWTENGSPLIHLSKLLQKDLGQKINLPVALCMRYGNPTPEAAFEKLVSENPDLEEVVLVPLYPHYAMSSFETAVVHVQSAYSKKKYSFSLKVLQPFYNHPKYIDALANSLQPFLSHQYDHILFSYHGIPERHVRKMDVTKSICLVKENCCDISSEVHSTCYRHQVFTTTKLTAQKLGMKKGTYSTSFQSRLGADAWLKPYTVEQLTQFPNQGIKRLLILCPAFVSDCLETLEEIQMEGRETFLNNGGEEFTVVPCLNNNADWIAALSELVMGTFSSIPSAVVAH